MAVNLSGFGNIPLNANLNTAGINTNTSGAYQSGSTNLNNAGSFSSAPAAPIYASYKPATSSPATLSAATTTPTGGGGNTGNYGGNGGFGNPSNPDLSNTYKQNLYNQYLASLGNAASQTSQAQIDAAVAQYNQMRANLEAQRQPLQDAFNQGISAIDTGITQNQNQAQTQQQLLNTNAQSGINTANQNYLQLQAQNRGVARAYGGYGSDFEEMQNRTGQNFGNTVSGIQNDLTTRVNDIQNSLGTYVSQANQQKAALGSQLEQGMKQIALDEYATDQQKAAAIGQIQSQYADHIANINQSILQFQQQFALAQQQAQTYLAAYGKSAQGFNPMSTANAMMSASPLTINGSNGQASGGLFFPTANNDKFPTIQG